MPRVITEVGALGDSIVIDATNRLSGEEPPTGHASIAEYVKAAGAAVVKNEGLRRQTLAAECPGQEPHRNSDDQRH